MSRPKPKATGHRTPDVEAVPLSRPKPTATGHRTPDIEAVPGSRSKPKTSGHQTPDIAAVPESRSKTKRHRTPDSQGANKVRSEKHSKSKTAKHRHRRSPDIESQNGSNRTEIDSEGDHRSPTVELFPEENRETEVIPGIDIVMFNKFKHFYEQFQGTDE